MVKCTVGEPSTDAVGALNAPGAVASIESIAASWGG
jgi:hypothetical protein